MFQAQYFGGEQRLDLGGASTSVILAAEVTPKEALAAELLLTAMGKTICCHNYNLSWGSLCGDITILFLFISTSNLHHRQRPLDYHVEKELRRRQDPGGRG